MDERAVFEDSAEYSGTRKSPLEVRFPRQQQQQKQQEYQPVVFSKQTQQYANSTNNFAAYRYQDCKIQEPLIASPRPSGGCGGDLARLHAGGQHAISTDQHQGPWVHQQESKNENRGKTRGVADIRDNSLSISRPQPAAECMGDIFDAAFFD